MEHFDLIIVGGGILGASHALSALEMGLSVALMEKNHEPQGATVRNFGQVVPSGMSAEWQLHGRNSLAIYKRLEQEFGIHARQNGSVYLASDAEELQLLEELAEINRFNDYPSQLLTAQECTERYPGLKAAYCVGGLFFPEEITLESRFAVLRILQYLQEQKGLRYYPNTQVSEVLPFGGGCIVGCSDKTSFRAEKVIVCNGSDFKTLFPELFYSSDIKVCKLQMLETMPQPTQRIAGSILTGLSIRRYEAFRECPSWKAIKSREAQDTLEKAWGVHILFKQSTENTIIIGDTHEYLPARDADGFGFDLRQDMNDFMVSKAQEIFELEDWRIRRSWAGYYCQCRNQDYFEHTIEGKIHLLTGIGGKGMTAGPGFSRAHLHKILNLDAEAGYGAPMAPRQLKMLVFDMAGTTIDEDNLVYKTVHQCVEESTGLELPYPEVLRIAAGKEKLQAIKDVLQEFSPSKIDLAASIYASFQTRLERAYAAGEFKSQAGALGVFRALKAKQIKVVLNTGYNRHTANLLLEHLGWNAPGLIDLVLTADDVKNGRPHPEMIQMAMQHFQLQEAAEVAKIGDSVIDIEEGINAGCSLVFGITTGAHTRAQLETAKPTAILDSLSELMVWV